MSIAALARGESERRQRQSTHVDQGARRVNLPRLLNGDREESSDGRGQQVVTDTASGLDPSTAEFLARQVPAEAIVIYTPLLAVTAHSSEAIKWLVTAGVLLVAVAYEAGRFRLDEREFGRDFKWPWRITLITTVSFLLYVCVVPAGPLWDYDWYTSGVAVAVSLFGNAGLGIWRLWTEHPTK